VVRRIVASNIGGTRVVVVVVVVGGGTVVVVVVVVVSGEVGSGIDSGPSPGLHATAVRHNATAAPSRLVVLRLSYTEAHRARSAHPGVSENTSFRWISSQFAPIDAANGANGRIGTRRGGVVSAS
jgi:hypothetical protein